MEIIKNTIIRLYAEVDDLTRKYTNTGTSKNKSRKNLIIMYHLSIVNDL
jgi:hypothetical protein